MKILSVGKLFGISAFSLMLAGCKYSDSYLVRHPDTFKSVLMRCQTLGEKANQDKQCPSAILLYEQVSNLSVELSDNPERFGQGVLKDQMLLGKLEDQIKQLKAKTNNSLKNKQLDLLEQKYQVLKRRVDIKIGIISQMEGV